MVQTSLSPWFSIKLRRQDAPWAWVHGDCPQRAIASLEALAALMGARAFIPLASESEHQNCLFAYHMQGDNQGNSYALSRLMSCSFPLLIVLMELSALLEARHASLCLEWIPRGKNEEADRLSNGKTEGFREELRCHPDREANLVLDQVWEQAVTFEKERQQLKRKKACTKAVAKKKPRQARLRVTDPW